MVDLEKIRKNTKAAFGGLVKGDPAFEASQVFDEIIESEINYVGPLIILRDALKDSVKGLKETDIKVQILNNLNANIKSSVALIKAMNQNIETNKGKPESLINGLNELYNNKSNIQSYYVGLSDGTKLYEKYMVLPEGSKSEINKLAAGAGLNALSVLSNPMQRSMRHSMLINELNKKTGKAKLGVKIDSSVIDVETKRINLEDKISSYNNISNRINQLKTTKKQGFFARLRTKVAIGGMAGAFKSVDALIKNEDAKIEPIRADVESFKKLDNVTVGVTTQPATVKPESSGDLAQSLKGIQRKYSGPSQVSAPKTPGKAMITDVSKAVKATTVNKTNVTLSVPKDSGIKISQKGTQTVIRATNPKEAGIKKIAELLKKAGHKNPVINTKKVDTAIMFIKELNSEGITPTFPDSITKNPEFIEKKKKLEQGNGQELKATTPKGPQ